MKHSTPVLLRVLYILKSQHSKTRVKMGS